MRTREIPVCGLAAVQAIFAKSPDAIRRLFFDAATGRRVAKISSYLAKAKRVYRMVGPEELAKIAGTLHHGGIVAVVEQAEAREAGAAEARAWAAAGESLVLLDRIGNAHNLGAIVRTAAFFGLRHVVIADSPQQARAGEAAHRVAEGGMAQVELHVVRDMEFFCRDLAAYYHVVGTAVTGAVPLRQLCKELRGERVSRPVALVLGNEESGLSSGVAKACTRLVTIPGSGRVESLNVSVAAAVLIWEIIVRNR